MAASFLQKLLKKPLPSPPLRILTSLIKTQSRSPPISPFVHQNSEPSPNPNPNPIPIYPSFPHCFALKPIYLHDLDQSDGEVGFDGGDGAEVWADSVKKKRKRKMNKHKLRKLRRKTKI